jgi:glutathione S-transferase
MTAKEVEEKAAKDFGVFEALLSQSLFLTGASPTAADCFLFALLDLVRLPPLLFTCTSSSDIVAFPATPWVASTRKRTVGSSKMLAVMSE